MRKNFPCVFLTALLVIALSQVLVFSAGQDNKSSAQTPKADAAANKPVESSATAKPHADVKPVSAKADDTKPQKQTDNKIILDTEVVNVIISVTDPYGRFV